MVDKDLKWESKSIGNAVGSILIDDSISSFGQGTDRERMEHPFPDHIEIHSRSGKFADSEDVFMYFYFRIDPYKENFRLSGRFEVLEMEEVPTQQTGYGILAADTTYSNKGAISRHRNHLLLGRFRTSDGRDHGYGLRAVGGYTDPEASEHKPVRKLDPTRVFHYQDEEDKISEGDACFFCLTKTDRGFEAVMQKNGNEESIIFPGCDFLLRQDKKTISIGFALAGNLKIRISDIQVDLSKGKRSKTPPEAIRCVIPDYPFPRSAFNDQRLLTAKESYRNRTVYVSPDGNICNKGSETEPLDIHTALHRAGEGTEIILLDGVYHLPEPLYLPSDVFGRYENRIYVHAKNQRQVLLDGSKLQKKSPLLVVRGCYWIFEGIIFQNAPLSGAMVCGSGNIIRNCEARRNGDTGILICSYPGEDRKRWPSYNRIEDCDSYDNCDPVLYNADGFGAKLSIGKGNEFYRCIAHHNIDDGFDLYNKSIIGPTEPVLLEKCIAYENGKTLNGRYVRKNHSGGIGFKLGGEYQAVGHEAWDCIAFLNNQCGFSCNSNPEIRLHYCTSFGNGNHHKSDNYAFYCLMNDMKPSWIKEKLFPRYRRKISGYLVDRLCCIMLKNRPIREKDGSIRFDYHSWRRRHSGANINTYPKKSVLMLISTLGGGGAERVTSILANELSQKYRVHLMHIYSGKEKYEIVPAVHVIDASWNDRLLHSRIRWPFKMLSVLSAKIRYRIDTTVSMLYKPNQYNSLIHWMDRRIMSERNDPSRKPVQEFEDAKKSYAKADLVVFQSERVQSLFSEDIQKKSTIIRNPISVSCYADRHPENKIVTVGRYVKQKNHKLLILSFSVFHRTHPAYTLHLYGDGPLLDELQMMIDGLCLDDAVFLEGFKNDIHNEIRNAKMFVLSSDYEGMSNALMEAMMMGIPCVSTACTGSDELLENEKTGLLVPVGDQEALTLAMSRLADDEDLRKRLQEQAQLQSIEFTKERVVRAWERIIFR